MYNSINNTVPQLLLLKNSILVLTVILVSSIVLVPSFADPSQTTKYDTKNLKIPASGSYSHDHKTNVHFAANPKLKSSTGTNGQDLKKAQGNYVAGQPWGSSAVTANQATQATQTQNSHQAQNAHQATQAQQAHENQPSHNSGIHTLPQLTKSNKPVLP